VVEVFSSGGKQTCEIRKRQKPEKPLIYVSTRKLAILGQKVQRSVVTIYAYDKWGGRQGSGFFIMILLGF
jgi:hypothetical protein